MRNSVSVKYTLISYLVGRIQKISLIFFILISSSGNIFNILGLIKYIIKTTFTSFFLPYLIWLPENLKVHAWFTLYFYWMMLVYKLVINHKLLWNYFYVNLSWLCSIIKSHYNSLTKIPFLPDLQSRLYAYSGSFLSDTFIQSWNIE